MTFSETIKHLCVHSVFVMVVVPHTYLLKVFAAGYFQSVLWKLMLLKNCRYTWTKIDYIYIALQVLYTVNMLNRFNAISPSILQCIFLFFFFFFSCFWADAYGPAWAGKVNVRATLSLFYSHHWESFQTVVRQGITLQYVLNIISEKGRTLMKTA